MNGFSVCDKCLVSFLFFFKKKKKEKKKKKKGKKKKKKKKKFFSSVLRICGCGVPRMLQKM